MPPPQLAPQGDQANVSDTQTKSPSQAENQPPISSSSTPQATAPASTIATLTAYGREYAPANLPRYDRIIFLLINGRRTVSDLSQLTKRPQEDVFATLQRLKNLQLITIETR